MNKRIAPNIPDPAINRAFNEVYDTLNELLSSTNASLDENIMLSSGNIGDFKVIKDYQTKNYKLAGKGIDGWVTSPAYLHTSAKGADLNQAQFDLTKYDAINYKNTVLSILNERAGETTGIKLGSLSKYAFFEVNKTGELSISSIGTSTTTLSLSRSLNGGDVNIKINNSFQATGSVDETASLIFQHNSIDAGWITSERTAAYLLATPTTQDSTMTFYTETDGVKLQRLKLQGSYVLAGSGAGHSTISSNGSYNLLLKTNSGTNSGFIQLTDGTNGGIVVQPHGTGELVLGSSSGSIHFATHNLYDANGNPWVTGTSTSSAVNNLTILNAATGDSPKISASGSDDNINLNLAAKGTGAVIADVSTGAMKLEYDGSNYVTFGVASDGHLSITGTGTDDDFTLDMGGNIVLDSLTDSFTFKDNGTERFAYGLGAFQIYGASGSTSEFFSISVLANGVTSVGTSDVGGTAGHMTLIPDGNLILDPVSKITIINESIVFNTQTHQDITSGGIAVDWNNGNKQSIDVTGTGYTLTMTNPAGPCNLVLKVIQGDGSDTITTWAASSGSIYWAGGAIPGLSTGNGAIDIISLYFDGTNYFAVASYGFATV
jgi:hypothetical protein